VEHESPQVRLTARPYLSDAQAALTAWSEGVRSCDRRVYVLLCMVVVMTCGMSQPAPQTSPATQHTPAVTTGAVPIPPRSNDPVAAKIATSIRSVVQRMQHDGLTATNASARQAESYTTPLVRVDQTGSVQTLLLVTTVEPQVEVLLEQQHARIEVVDAEQRLVQAWIPFDRLEQIAALPFVQYIRPPSYTVRR
jgi:hypothetical protein